MKIGSTTITNCKIGSVQVKEVRIGSTLVWSGFDADAQLFITNAGITDATQQTAVNNLVVALKGYGIWTKMKAIYPFVGGSAAQHKYNLRNPLDSDTAFRLVFSGGFTHDINGITGNATNSIATTFLNASTNLINSNLHLSWYSRTANTSGAFSPEISLNGGYIQSSWITFRINNKTSGIAAFTAGNDNVAAAVSQTQNGFFIGSEIASNLRKLYRNGSAIATNTTNDTNALPNLNVSLMGGGGSFSANNCALASIGDGLTDTEASNYYTAVQAFQTSLARNI